MKLGDMSVLLTGATGGIGTHVAERLAAGGARLLLAARGGERLQALCERLRGRGADVEMVAADLSTSAGREHILSAARSRPGGINVLINNAGINRFGRFADLGGAGIESILDTNLLAPMLLTQSLLPLLAARDEAAIVNVGSILGSLGLPGQVTYAASKFAMHGFSEALRRELCDTGVRVVYVAPRSTDTEMNEPELRRLNEQTGVSTDDAAAVARLIVAALERGRPERFIGWPERLFVKLNAVLPSLVDRSLRKQARLVNRAPPSTDGLTFTDGVKS